MSESKEIGIVGYWFATNYGGVASYYSLYQKIQELGFNPFLVENPYFETDKEGKDVFSRNFFLKENAQIAPSYNYSQLNHLNNLADTFILGSDQVLTSSSIKSFGKLFLMEFAENGKKRIAFSASCGGDNLNSEPDLINYAKSQLKKFFAVSVREYSAVDIVKNRFDLLSEVVIDPIFFTSAEKYKELGKRAQQIPNSPYLLAYILDPTADKKKCIEYLASHLTLDKKIILDGRKFTHENNVIKMDLPADTLPELDEYQWFNYFSNAEYIITDSFHGAVMAIILNKPFIMYANHGRGYPRFLTLAQMFNLHSRLIENSKDLIVEKIDEQIDFSKLNSIINSEITKATDWLKFMLKAKSTSTIKSIDYNLDIKNKCTGCSACYNICPTKTISLIENNEGFINPVVNKDNCINCGLCTQKCIVLNPTYENNPEPDCYAVMANDEIRTQSSSGGAFSVAAEWVLKHNGIICGAAFDDDYKVKHILISKKEDLSLLRGSKYYQSNITDLYTQIKLLLENNKYVLFTGMPCQVAGLYSFLGKKYPKLYTIDLLCHGISSYKVFKKYWQDILGDKPLTDLKFKAKQPWGWHAGVNAWFADGTTYSKIIEEDLFYVAYIQGLSKNTTCGTCLFNRLPRQGDLTIGDFWRIQDFNKDLNDNKGTSVVLVNNEQGQFLFKKISSNFAVQEKVPISYAIAGNGIIKHPYSLNQNRNLFFQNLDNLNFSNLVNSFRRRGEDFILSLPPEIREFYYLANIVAKNKGCRKVVMWGENFSFRNFMSKHFGINVEFILTTNTNAVNGKTIRHFDEIKSLSSTYYVIVLGKAFNEADYRKFLSYGFVAVKDFIYRMINPIVLENYDLSNGYTDMFGNVIKGVNGIVKRIVFRGYNNKIFIQKNVWNLKNLVIDLTANSSVQIDSNTNFTQPDTKIETRGYDGTADVKIRSSCIFMDTLFRLFLHRQGTLILINEKTTFGERMSLRANQGKRIIIGKDCMFSSDIELWAGDGHTIMDINSNKPLNLFPADYGNSKNMIVFGNHTWIGFRSFIMAGANIGEGSIIGAQSVVKGIFPNNCSIGGTPAKIIRKDIAWSRDMIADDLSKCNGYTRLTSKSNAPLCGKTVLVIGGTLFMGVQLVKNLIALGNKVTIATRGKHKDDFGNEVERVILDISKPESVKNALRGRSFDVIFHNLAYCSNYVKNLMNATNCKRYVQLSSFEVYTNHHYDIKEEEFNNETCKLVWNEMTAGYIAGKQQAECALFQIYNDRNPITIRIPYVTKTERLYYYCECIVKEIPMNIDDIDRCFTFIRDIDVGTFLPWIAAQNYTGVLNFSAEGYVSIKNILEYIEKKTGKKAIIDTANGKESPFHVFNEKTFSLCLDKLKSLDYQPEKLDSWFWNLLDEYIARAMSSKMQ